jgi:phosphomannomutase / phosphoglucomutase
VSASASGGPRAAFKAYDIRGRVPDELNEDVAHRIGMSLADALRPGPIVLGRDVRLSSPPLQGALAEGLRGQGRDVVDIGLCGTEEVYFHTAHRGAAGGVMVTASHNPMDYNGMKLVRDGARPISGDSGLDALREQVLAGTSPVAPSTRGSLLLDPDKSAYIDRLLKYVDRDALRPLRGAGQVIDELAPHLPFEFIRIQHDPDGTFPHGIPNPLLPGSRAATAEAVRVHRADLGIAWDGDFDRCFFFDGEGRFIEGYYLVGLLAAALLARHPGGRVIHDPRLIWNTVEMVRDAGGVPVMSKTGHAFIKERMRAEDAIYGGEMSAHHYFRDFAYCDSGMIPWLLVAGLVAAGTPLAEMVEERMRRYPCSGEINFRVSDATAATCEVLASLGGNPTLDFTDGVSADFGTWRMSLRSSNTEPLLRLNVESRGEPALVEDRVGHVRRALEQFAA